MILTYIDKSLLSHVLKINILELEQQQEVVQKVQKTWENMDKNDRYSTLFSLKECFFRAMTTEQKEFYIKVLVKEITDDVCNTCDLLELLGHLIKYVEFDVQPIIQSVLLIAPKLCKPKDCIGMMNFVKYAWDVCYEGIRCQIRGFLQKITYSSNADLAEVADDTIYAIDSSPVCKSNSELALVIPEFLTSDSFLQQPIDFLSVLSALERNGLQGDIIDNRVHNFSLYHLSQILEPYNTIIITSSPVDMLQKYYVDYRYCVFCETVNWLYNYYPEKQILVCGAHGTVSNKLLCKDINCHQILIGENTKAILTYFLGKEQEEVPLFNYPLQLKAIDMNWYFGRKIVNQITYHQKQYSIFQLSQGCPYHCIYCFNIYGHEVSRMPVKKAITQLRYLKNAGVKHIFFIDQTFTLDSSYIHELCKEMCNQKLSLTWQCETRADLINRALLQDMKDAGCTAIWLGFESFSQRVLDANKKQLNNKQQLQAIYTIKEVGIDCFGFVMLGMAADTSETIKKTIDTIIKYKIHTSRTANLCTVRIGTELYDKAMMENLIRIDSFCHLEAFRGRLFNDLTESELTQALQRFSAYLG